MKLRLSTQEKPRRLAHTPQSYDVVELARSTTASQARLESGPCGRLVLVRVRAIELGPIWLRASTVPSPSPYLSLISVAQGSAVFRPVLSVTGSRDESRNGIDAWRAVA